ncbi:MAG: hypothetical protein ACREFZ_01695 [Acetobacteraceae bacterium]
MRTGEVPSRRGALRLLVAVSGAGVVGATWPAPAQSRIAAKPFPNGVTVLAASTPNGPMDAWAALLLPALGHCLSAATRVREETAIGNDGITGANQFAARIVPDGTTALLVPGSAATAWLLGDPRVHFDVARWVPVLAGITASVVVGKVKQAHLLGRRPLRIAIGEKVDPDLPALLALDLLGCPVSPVFGPGDPALGRAALSKGSVDLLYLHGEDVPQRMRALGVEGAAPLFSMGALDATGQRTRDPLLPNVPCFHEISLRLKRSLPQGPLARAWSSAAAAGSLNFALVLPNLAPASIIGLWRSVGAQLTRAPAVRALSDAAAVHIEACPEANVTTRAVAADPTALLALRAWVAKRYGLHRG